MLLFYMGPIEKQLISEIQKLHDKCILEANAIVRNKKRTAEQLADAEAYSHMASGMQQCIYILHGYFKDYKLKAKS